MLRRSTNKMTHARSSRDLSHFKGDNRKSVQPKYVFAVDKDDLNENIDDVVKNFDCFSQFATQLAQEDSIDVENDNEVFEGTTTPTNPESPKDNTSLEFNQTRYPFLF